MQQQIFDLIHKLFGDYIRSRSAKFLNKLFLFYLSLTGGCGAGKSHTIKTIYMNIIKVLMHKGGNSEKARILVLAPTGAPTVNISGTTIHSGLGTNVGSKTFLLNYWQQ